MKEVEMSDVTLLSLVEVAGLLSVSRTTAAELVKDLEVPRIKIGKTIRYPRGQLIATINDTARQYSELLPITDLL
ncbi:helix-turn-helix domain-containing protein [Weissella viridescens]|uniref:helix-turn-helix domain-containing protein n=1 Tax=Weissella viridescens TaxID=1629 RepID=UPI003AF2955B